MKHYEIHLRNVQDSYAYAGLKCYSKENLKIHTGVNFGVVVGPPVKCRCVDLWTCGFSNV